MLSNISLGRYYPAHSILHDTDPRVKTILYGIYLVSIFIIKQPVSIAILAGIIVVQLILGKITPKVLWATVKPVIPLALFIFLINIFTIRDGNVLFSWKIITITDYGISRAAIMAIRLVFLITGSSIMTLTTTPNNLTDGMESVLGPLKKIRVPVHEISMMMSIALRFIPILLEETDKIMKAQMARGADFESGSLIKRAKSLVPLLVPLFISAFRRAMDLAMAMEARCYRGGEGRTKMKPLIYKKRDRIAYGVLYSYLIVAIVVGRILFR